MALAIIEQIIKERRSLNRFASKFPTMSKRWEEEGMMKLEAGVRWADER